jgi:hypothetical protein
MVVAHHIAELVETELVSPKPTTAGIWMRIGETSHRFEVDVLDGRFPRSLEGYVESALEFHFRYQMRHMNKEQREFLLHTVCGLICDRHEASLPKPPDPRRLPLRLPELSKAKDVKGFSAFARRG